LQPQQPLLPLQRIVRLLVLAEGPSMILQAWLSRLQSLLEIFLLGPHKVPQMADADDQMAELKDS